MTNKTRHIIIAGWYSYAIRFALLLVFNLIFYISYSQQTLVILHTNDLHSQIEPAKNGYGGFARIAALIKQAREEEGEILVLDAGDVFQGTPYFNKFKGELEYKLMSKIGFDASTLGNHEFDNGVDELGRQLKEATFAVVNCNYDFSKSPLNAMVKPYKVFEKKGLRIGVLGIGVNPKGLIDSLNFLNIKYLDPVEKANETAQLLKEKEKCDLVVCLSHLGFDSEEVSDIELAKKSSNIDIIIGGHTHTILKEAHYETNLGGEKVLIVQTGKSGKNIGKIKCYFEKSNKKTEKK